MIVEMRTYTLRLGAMPAFLQRYAREGRPVQVEHLGEPLAYLSSDIGALNQVVHLWRYESFEDRTRRRAALEADPRWLAYRGRSLADDHLLQQSNSILNAVDFAALA